jgi:hypothetical protein
MITETLTDYFVDFGVNATKGTATVQGLFDNPSADAFGLISGTNPEFRCFSSAGVVRGDTLVISGTSYKVAQVEPDGTGLSVCRLESV